jgi:hypothetical protein
MSFSSVNGGIMKLTMAMRTITNIYNVDMAAKILATYISKVACEELNIEEPEICTYTRATKEIALYIPETKQIGLNMKYVKELILSASTMNMKPINEVAEFIVHEIRHAWQYAGNMEIPKNYVNGNANFDKYYNQPIEIDAREYAKENYRRYLHAAESMIIGMAEYMLNM